MLRRLFLKSCALIPCGFLFGTKSDASTMEFLDVLIGRLKRWKSANVSYLENAKGVHWITFTTKTHTYHIDIDPKKDYMGAFVTAREPRKGEDWLRGNDLHDGKMTTETWGNIMADIVAYELD